MLSIVFSLYVVTSTKEIDIDISEISIMVAHLEPTFLIEGKDQSAPSSMKLQKEATVRNSVIKFKFQK